MSIILPQTRGVLHAGKDPYFSSVVFLSHMDEMTGPEVKSAVGGHLSPNGLAVLSTTQAKFGAKSLNVSVDTNSFGHTSIDYDPGTADFTWEGYFYTSSVSVFQCPLAIGANGVESTAMRVYVGNDGSLRYYYQATARITSAVSVVTINTWHFWQLRRIGTDTELALNGVKVGSTYTDTNNYGGDTALWVGSSNYPGSGEGVRGYVDEYRITNGVGRAFGVPSSPFPNSG